jgi:RimJ/RimL family protein N-acetyltransferase
VPDFRPIVPEDIDSLAALVADAFVGYRAFAPTDWQPPPATQEAAVLRGWIADPDFWGEVALDDRALVAHVALIPASHHGFGPVPDPALAHLGHLFLKPAYWGSGIAADLLARAVNAASTRDFNTMRLFVPLEHVRARRFYARAGFHARGEPFDPGFGLPLLEYRRLLDGNPQR